MTSSALLSAGLEDQVIASLLTDTASYRCLVMRERPGWRAALQPALASRGLAASLSPGWDAW